MEQTYYLERIDEDEGGIRYEIQHSDQDNNDNTLPVCLAQIIYWSF